MLAQASIDGSLDGIQAHQPATQAGSILSTGEWRQPEAAATGQTLLHAWQERRGTFADLVTVRVPLCGRVAEMEPDENP
jgi:hypothetical protein